MDDDTSLEPKFQFHLYFYANPFKTTIPHSFEKFKKIAPEDGWTRLVQSRKIVVELFSQVNLSAQNKDMEALPQKMSTTQEALDAATIEYLSLMQPIYKNGSLCSMETFQWSNMLVDKAKVFQGDALFECMSVLLNYGLWYQAEGCRILQTVTTENFEEPHKQAYRMFLKAVSIYDRLMIEASPLAEIQGLLDFQSNVLKARRMEALCQAQQVTIARGIIKKNSHSLLSRLALDLANKYSEIYHLLNEYDFPRMQNTGVSKWRYWIKSEQAVADALCCILQANTLVDEKKCGDAIFLHEYATNLVNQNAIPAFEMFCEKAPKTNMKFVVDRLKNVREYLKEAAAKAKRENELIYFETVPKERPKLPEPQSLIKTEEFRMPDINPLVAALESFSLPPAAQPPAETPHEAAPSQDPPVKSGSKPDKAKDDCTIA